MDKLDRLYEIYSILEDGKVADHEAEFLEIIESVNGNGNEKEKGLACQFIPKFVKHFPHLFQKALDAQLDLAEDDNVNVRKMAIKYLPGFCKVSNTCASKIADVLTQMLHSDDSSEFATVQSALSVVMEVDIRGCLQGIMTQISATEESGIRKRAIEFLSSKFRYYFSNDLLTKEVEEFFLDACKAALPKVSGQDFLSLLPLLSHLKIAKTIPVQNTIIDIIATQLDANEDFDVSHENIAGFLNFLKQACPFFSPFINSKRFVSYITLTVFPKLGQIKNLENGNDLILDIFKVLAEISAFIHSSLFAYDEVVEYTEVVFNELLNYIPLPPESDSEKDLNADPDLHFTHIECLLYTFVMFLKHNDTVITSIENVSRFKDLKLRLQFLSRVIMRALKRFKESPKVAKDKASDNEETKQRLIAERTMSNLNTLIKEFFRNPPSFKPIISLSWKSTTSSFNLGVKRHYEAEASSSVEKFQRREKRPYRELYVPPSGKYSSRLGGFKGRGGRF